MTGAVERFRLAGELTVSRVITGLWQVADMERNGEALDADVASRAMSPYVEAGFTTFDMADHYGSAEVIAGRFRTTAASGHGCELLTKWVPPPGPVSRAQVRAAVERARGRLNADQIDLLQFHTWRYVDPSWLDALLWLQELKAEGLVRQLGVTNFDTAHLRIAVRSGIEIVSNQVSYSIIDRRAAGRMTAFCAENGITLLAYGALAGGFLSERWLGAAEPRDGTLSTWSLMKYKRFIDASGGWSSFQRVLRTAQQVAQKLGVSIANVSARYVLEQPAVGAVIVGARLGEREHLDETKKLFGFSLDDAGRASLSEAIDSLQPIPGDCGDEYRHAPYLTASGDLSHHVQTMPTPYPSSSDEAGRQHVSSGTVWEDIAGFCRAVRTGNRVLVSGTTATHGGRCVGGDDAAAQTHFVIDKIEGALQSVGATVQDVIRTRVFVRRIADWKAVARVHGERFAAIRPVNTLVQAELVGEDYLVEIEAEAEVRVSAM